jgi:hypothetical protein
MQVARHLSDLGEDALGTRLAVAFGAIARNRLGDAVEQGFNGRRLGLGAGHAVLGRFGDAVEQGL